LAKNPRRITIALDKDLEQKLEKATKINKNIRIPYSEIVRAALEEYLENFQGGKINE